MQVLGAGIDLLARMERAVDKVRDRLERVARALESAGVPYCVVGGNAVAAWVATVDESAVRNTRDVDVLLERTDLERAARALAREGFVHRHVRGVDLFLDGPDAKARDAVHVVFAREPVRAEYQLPAPSTDEAVPVESGFRVVRLDALARMKLTSFRDKDRMHLRDLIDVGLLGRDDCAALPPTLAERLAHLLDHPED